MSWRPAVHMPQTNATSLRVGVLAIQGAFAEHDFCLKAAFDDIKKEDGRTQFDDFVLQVVEVRTRQDVPDLDGLIIPGGESTTMSLLLKRNNFQETLCTWLEGKAGNKPILWGTCAGLILMSDRVKEIKQGGQFMLGGLDITTTRNIYGRQHESFETELQLHGEMLTLSQETCADESHYRGIFIRAPGISSVDGANVELLASVTHRNITSAVAVRQDNLIATAFHPELTDDHRWHAYFLQLVRNAKVARLGETPVTQAQTDSL